jgi:riboflavin kinase/FMN adenylyltransferase
MNNWHKGIVISGNKLGSAIGFPTLNIKNPEILEGEKLGVYAALVKIKNKIYQAVLFFGPRLILHEKKNVLEIFVFDFDEEIYNQPVSFKLIKYIRPALNFQDMKSYKKQLADDTTKARAILTRFPK